MTPRSLTTNSWAGMGGRNWSSETCCYTVVSSVEATVAMEATVITMEATVVTMEATIVIVEATVVTMEATSL